MAFVRVVSCNDDRMHIVKSPGILSWSIFIGILSLGLGAIFYGNEDIFKQIFYVVCCLLIGASFLEDWEDCIIDRAGSQIVLSRANIYQKLLGFSKKRDVILSIQSVMNVTASAQKASPEKPQSCSTTLVLKSGLSMPIIECSTNDQAACEQLAEKISKFMRLSRMETVVQDSLDFGFYYSDGSSSESEEDKEKVRCVGWPRETITSVIDDR